MKQITRWSPDTCNCVIELEWDDVADPTTRTHKLTNFVSICNQHEKTTDDASRYGKVMDENVRKNRAFAICQEELKITNEEYSFLYTEDRLLRVRLVGRSVTPSEKGRVNARFNSEFGAGKAVLE